MLRDHRTSKLLLAIPINLELFPEVPANFSLLFTPDDMSRPPGMFVLLHKALPGGLSLSISEFQG